MLIESYLKYIENRFYITPDEFIKTGFILVTVEMWPLEVSINDEFIICKLPYAYVLYGKYLYLDNTIIEEYFFKDQVELTEFKNALLKFSHYNFITAKN